MTWLVTGGAGYIGAHVVRAFVDQGITPVVVDDLSTGQAAFVPPDVAFVEGSILDTTALTRVMNDYRCVGVVHVAAFKYAGVSVAQPLHTYQQNVAGTMSVLTAMHEAGVHNVVFSSSAATYGTPSTDIVTEESPTHPESPYGESKLIGEWLLADQARALAPNDGGLRHTSLRYFNVVGSGTPEVYDSSPYNLFPRVIEALIDGKTPEINGTDYPTPDGTCVRDYIHVSDLALAHVAAAQAMSREDVLEPIYNLGSGQGHSVREIMTAMADVTGIAFTPTEGPRRPGDPARIVANGDLAARDLDWAMRHTLKDMVASAWTARTAH